MRQIRLAKPSQVGGGGESRAWFDLVWGFETHCKQALHSKHYS